MLLLLPFATLMAALTPMAMLLFPVVLLANALAPLAVLLPPEVFSISALTPLAVLPPPLVLLASVPAPIAVLVFRSLGAAKKPFMSMITFVVAGPWLYRLIPPLTVPAETMAALLTMAPCGSSKAATKGCG